LGGTLVRSENGKKKKIRDREIREGPSFRRGVQGRDLKNNGDKERQQRRKSLYVVHGYL